jgi:hypothetical protein
MTLGRPVGEAREYARVNVIPILDDRHNGLSCRAIAEKYRIPEYTVWEIMKETGYSGRVRAKPVQKKRKQKNINPDYALRVFQALGDEMVIERSADNTGWIVFIDDIPGVQCDTLGAAIVSAYTTWIKGVSDDQ